MANKNSQVLLTKNLSHEQLKYWMKYIKLIGINNFFYKEPQHGMPHIIDTKHYVGWDSTFSEDNDFILNGACKRAEMYNETIAKENLAYEQIDKLFVIAITHQYYDEELLFILTKYQHCLSDKEHWKLITDYWIMQELNCDGERAVTWKKVFNLRKALPSLTKELPKTFTAYRYGKGSGYSWTLDKGVAEWYKRRFEGITDREALHERRFKRDDALFYTNNRNEQEVVILQ